MPSEAYRRHQKKNDKRMQRDKEKLRPQAPLFIAGERWDLTFNLDEVSDVIEMWQDGRHIADIADKLKRDDEEIIILIMDLAEGGRVGRRPFGVFGGEAETPEMRVARPRIVRHQT